MGTTALTVRIGLPVARQRARPAACGLTFDRPGGPLVAVCGLVGGSGCSTLAYNVARQAARESKAPVLLTEPDSQRAGLAVLVGQASPHSLAALASRLAAGEPSERAFVELEPRLRLLASTPRRVPEPKADELRALLREARAAHGLVIVDCGTGWPAAEPVLAEATHLIWTLPATPVALARARVLLASGALPAAGRWREALAASTLDGGPRPTVRALRRLAAKRCERLVLVTYREALARGEHPDGDERMLRALTGLAATLRRTG